MKSFTRLAMLSGIAALTGVCAANAQTFGAQGPKVERSGRTFHIQACPGPASPRTARCHAHIVTDSRGNILTSNGHGGGGGAPSGYGPATLRAAYGIIGNGSSATTVAIVDAYGYPNAASDLAVYRKQFNLPVCGAGCLTIVNEQGQTTNLPRANTGWDQEQALDLDMVSAMCPGCKILLVQASSTSDADLGAAVNEAAALGAKVISNSYGGGESGASSYDKNYNHPGVAVTASAGDSGYGPQFPATSEWVIAVGGTSLTMSGLTRGSETVWSGTGSGCSTQFNALSWAASSGANATCSMRMETDISAVADPQTGVAVYGPPSARGSAWMVFGGTSVAAPLIGGIFGEKGGAVNYSQEIYTAAASAFHDITSGSNGNCTITYYCTAGMDYDGPTGRGTPAGDSAF